MSGEGGDGRRDEVRYRISPDDVIVSVAGAWDRFAEDNDALHLVGGPLGESFLDHLAGVETRELLRAILHRTRERGRPVELPYRCDAPDRRRFMRLRIEPEGDGSLLFRSWIVREELREPVPVLRPDASRSDELLRMCAWCKGVRVDDEWVEVEEAVKRLNLLGHEAVPQLSHGVCGRCRTEMLSAVEADPDAG